MLNLIYLMMGYYTINAQCCSQTEITCSNQQYATCDQCGFLEMCNTKNRQCNSCQKLIPFCNTCDCRTKKCFSCLPQYYFDSTNTQCLPYKACPLVDCPAGYYANIQCKCLECKIPDCLTCSRSNYCDTCRPNYFSYSLLFDSSDTMRCYKTNQGSLMQFNLQGELVPVSCNFTEQQLTVGYACLTQQQINQINSIYSMLFSYLILSIL